MKDHLEKKKKKKKKKGYWRHFDLAYTVRMKKGKIAKSSHKARCSRRSTSSTTEGCFMINHHVRFA